MTLFEHFDLKDHPFSETIDMERIQLDGRFQSALLPLLELPNLGDIATLIGRTGTGKTTLLRQVIYQWREIHDVHYLHLGNLKGSGLMRAILNVIGERPRMGKDRMFGQLFSHLSKKQRPLCLLIDEVQLMDIQSMTDLRLLVGDIELSGRLKMVLAGQPQMAKTLQAESLTDLRERLTLQVKLARMTLPETHAYVEHRLEKAGGSPSLFDEASIKLIFHHTEGVPRRVNRVALNALMIARQKGLKTIDEVITREACVAEQA